MQKKPTLKDVSRLSGLSVFTVSRALSGPDGVSEESRRRVLEAAQELGYMPNRAAQQLRKNTRSSVAVLTASTSNYYYIDMMNGIYRALRSSNRTAVVADIASEGAYSAELEDATVQEVIRARTAGVISTLTLSSENTRLLADWDIPLVFVDSEPPADAEDLPGITMDNVTAGRRVGAHLAEHGYGDWLFLVYPSLWSTRAYRERGIREAAEEHGADLVVLESDNSNADAYKTLAEYLDSPSGHVPRALIAGNNPMVHGSLSVLQDRGLRVPEDVAVIGFDEFSWARLLHPPLTVLDEDSEAIGARATTILMRIIDEQLEAERAGLPPAPRYRPEDREEVQGELIIRRSCGC
jgi:LacI family transcriptional regulator